MGIVLFQRLHQSKQWRATASNEDHVSLQGVGYVGLRGERTQSGVLPIGKVARRGGDAFDAIMRHVGDDASAMLNEAGDLILQSRNGMKEVRFDFNNPAPHASPHVHVIEYKQVKNKKVETRNDRIYPNDVPHR